jgi:hypothetical protein
VEFDELADKQRDVPFLTAHRIRKSSRGYLRLATQYLKRTTQSTMSRLLRRFPRGYTIGIPDQACYVDPANLVVTAHRKSSNTFAYTMALKGYMHE